MNKPIIKLFTDALVKSVFRQMYYLRAWKKITSNRYYSGWHCDTPTQTVKALEEYSQAQKFYDDYMAKFPGLKEYLK